MEFTDNLTKDQAIDRQNEILERALQSIDAMFLEIGPKYGIEDHAGNGFPRDFMRWIPTDPISEHIFQDLWNIREEICSNSIFMTIEPDESENKEAR